MEKKRSNENPSESSKKKKKKFKTFFFLRSFEEIQDGKKLKKKGRKTLPCEGKKIAKKNLERRKFNTGTFVGYEIKVLFFADV